MRILVTGASGVLGRATVPLLRGSGHDVRTPSSTEVDLSDARAVAAALDSDGGAQAVLHLATRIPPLERMGDPGAWAENDRLRDGATSRLVDETLGARQTRVEVIVVPTVAFVYPPGPADETTPVADVPAHLRSALRAEAHLDRFTAAGRRGVALRLGALYGPGAASPVPTGRFEANLHTADAGTALLAALACPGGIYNVVDDADPVSAARFTAATGWRPRQGR